MICLSFFVCIPRVNCEFIFRKNTLLSLWSRGKHAYNMFFSPAFPLFPNIQIDTNLGKSPDYTLCVFYCSRFFFQKFPIRWDFIIFLKHTLSFPILLIKLFFKTAVPLPHIVEIHALSMPTKWGI